MSDDVPMTDAAPPSEPAPSQPPALEPASQPPSAPAASEAPAAAAAPPAAPVASTAPVAAPVTAASASVAPSSSTPRKIPKKAPEKIEKRKAVDPPKAAAAPPTKRIAENNRDKPNGSAAAADDSDDEQPLFKKSKDKPEPKSVSSPRKESKEAASSSGENGDKDERPKPKEREEKKESASSSASKSSGSSKKAEPVKKGQAVVVTKKKKEKKQKEVYEEVAGDDDALEEAERKLEGEKKRKRKRKSSDDEAFDEEEEPEEEEDEEEEESDFEEERKKKKHKKDKKKDKEKKKHKKDKKKHKKDKKKDKEKDKVHKRRKRSSTSNEGMSRQVVNDATKYQEMEEIVPLQATKGANKWWDRTDRDANIKWETLVHNGVLFPPAYEPHGIKMLYDGKEVDLTPEEEEVATMYAGMLETDFVKNKVFNKNFFNDWSKILGKGHVIQKLDKCDFTPIHTHLCKVRDEKKEQRKEPKYKKEQKEEKERLQAIYGTAIVDGYKEKVGNYRVEPPGLFRGRGQHPKSGFLKRRVQPEDVIINIGKGVPIPKCPIPGHHWKGVIHNQEVTWLAYWKDNINKDFKYVFLAANSRFKGESDLKKYEKARKLKSHIDQIRKDYTMGLASKDLASRQLAVTMYLIDKLALRVGNEKDTKEEADTVGCCSLRVEHLKLTPPNRILFDFLGKDSMRYLNEVEVDTRVYNNIAEFMADKKPGTDVFDKITPTILNQHLSSLMAGLTAKVFRTYNASVTLQQELFETKQPASPDQIIGEKVLFYNRANREVAILCNHQRTVPKGYEIQMTKLDETLKDLNLRLQILEDHLEDVKGGKKKKNKADRPKLEAEYQEFADKLPTDANSIEKRITTMKTRIANNETKKQLKNDTKTVALGTSKINYMDPRITVAWCKASETPIEKIFNKSLMSKFPWAMEVSMDWRF